MVSIITPVFNAEKHLSECIESVIGQSYEEWQLILVDDGSEDRSGAICDRYAEKDKRIIVIHQKNQGSISARRNGVMSANSDYCCFLDADDILPANSLALMMLSMPEDNKKTVVIGNSVRIFRKCTLKSKFVAPCFGLDSKTEFKHAEFLNNLYCSWFGISNVPVGLWAKMFPTEMLKETFVTIPNVVRFMGDDLIVTLDLMPKADKVVIISDAVYKYRVGGGTTKYQPELMNDWLNLYRFKQSYAEQYPMPQNIHKLMDSELINMTFSFFAMLDNCNKLTDSIILETCSINEVFRGASNPDIDHSFSKAKAISAKDVFAVRKLLKKSFKQKILDKFKKAMYRLA